MRKIITIIISAMFLFMVIPNTSLAESYTFTSSGTFTVPTGVSSLTAVVIGGGGAGAGGTNEGAGAGGGGGGYSVGSFSVSPGSVYSVIVGPGGVHGSAPHCEPGASSPGGAGGYSLIGPVVAYGGGGGQTAGAPGYGGYGTASYGYYGSYPPGGRWSSIGGAGGMSGSGGAGGAGGIDGTAMTCAGYIDESTCGYWTGGTPMVYPQPGSVWGGGGGGVWSPNAWQGSGYATCDYGPIYGANGAQGVVVVSWTYDAPTSSSSVSPNPVTYGGSTNITLSSTNAYYCHVYRINAAGSWIELQSGYFTSGTWNTGSLTDPGTHYAATYCYNPVWTGSGWTYRAFTVSVTPPAINNVTISNGVVVTNGVNQYTITSTATDTIGGGSAITDELALVNYQGPNAGTYRGYVGWSSVGFTFFGGSYKTTPIACSGGGSAAIYNGYGPEHINLISCSTSVSGNIRTVSYVVTFNTSFTSPINSNTLSGFAHNATTGLYSGWSPFSAFTITPTCSNGANNYPTCNTCSTPLGWNGSICTTCSNGGCTNGVCSNGANNPVSCNTCSTGFIWQSSTSSCIPSTPPTASITSPAVNITIYDDQEQQFTGTATDPDGTVVAYEWRTSNCSTGTIISSLASFVRSFTVGTYTIYFRAQDNDGAWSTNCPSRVIQVLEHNPVAGVCGSANGVPTQKKPTSNLCDTLGLPGPTVLPVGIDILPENNPALSWSWTCAGEYGGNDTFCGSNNSCGDGKCQASKGESPARCRADCKVKFFEF